MRPRTAAASALSVVENMTQEGVLDAHAQRAATEHQAQDFRIGDDGRADQAVIAEAIRHIERKQPGVRISGQRRQFGGGKFAAGGVELGGALEQLLDPFQPLPRPRSGIRSGIGSAARR